MKLMTSAEATTSNVPSGNGSVSASATRKSARCPSGSPRTWSICSAEGSMYNVPQGKRIEHQLGERSAAAAYIEPARILWWSDPVEEGHAHLAAPAPHEALIGYSVVVSMRDVGHVVRAAPDVVCCAAASAFIRTCSSIVMANDASRDSMGCSPCSCSGSEIHHPLRPDWERTSDSGHQPPLCAPGRCLAKVQLPRYNAHRNPAGGDEPCVARSQLSPFSPFCLSLHPRRLKYLTTLVR